MSFGVAIDNLVRMPGPGLGGSVGLIVAHSYTFCDGVCLPSKNQALHAPRRCPLHYIWRFTVFQRKNAKSSPGREGGQGGSTRTLGLTDVANPARSRGVLRKKCPVLARLQDRRASPPSRGCTDLGAFVTAAGMLARSVLRTTEDRNPPCQDGLQSLVRGGSMALGDRSKKTHFPTQ
jgi:hypothetical protein